MYTLRFIALWFVLFMTLVYFNVSLVGQVIVYLIVGGLMLNEIHDCFRMMRRD